MKKALVTVIVVLAAVGIIFSACSKKRTVPVAPEDLGTATHTATFTNTPTATDTWDTSIPTNTFTRTFTSTPTNTPIPKPAGWIDDCEDIYGPNQNDFQVTGGPVLNSGGYWITYDDNSKQNNGTSYVWPMSDTWAERKAVSPEPFVMSAPGYSGSPYGQGYAARVTGYVTGCEGGSGSWWLDTTCTGAGTITIYNPAEETTVFRFGFIGMGCQLTPTAGEGATGYATGMTGVAGLIDDPIDCQEVDLSGFTGIRFWYKGDGMNWRVKIPFTNQLNCDGKYHPEMPVGEEAAIMSSASYTKANDAGFNIVASATDWTLIEIPFTSLAYETWSNPLVNAADCSAPGGDCAIATVLQHVKQIQFQTFGDPAADNRYPNSRELWIDDIELY
ncbi:MAG: hypothetical protein CVV21_12045 [Candidatus Goldiibacteriota bacterium HGW-Goldbacteria-1]|jgi:hypothetical protein|nr:MAG: hypothetical protein CVV21_12045 [Candidatus Goldiibacteriota bacterium HGW-Goldbacteria-1]